MSRVTKGADELIDVNGLTVSRLRPVVVENAHDQGRILLTNTANKRLEINIFLPDG